MAFPLNRVFFFLVAVLVLRAPPALSVPLASAVAYGGSDYLLASSGQVNAEGEAEGSELRAEIVSTEQLAYGPTVEKSEAAAPHSDFGMSGQASIGASGSSHSPGWLMPGAAVGAGGGALFALASHGKNHGNGNGGSGGNGGGPGANPGLGIGHDGTPGDSEVPEPGIVTLMGIGIASILGRRKLAR